VKRYLDDYLEARAAGLSPIEARDRALSLALRRNHAQHD